MTPNPGSPEAKQRGCECACIDNHHGKGRGGDGEKYGWYITGGCQVHWPDETKKPTWKDDR